MGSGERGYSKRRLSTGAAVCQRQKAVRQASNPVLQLPADALRGTDGAGGALEQGGETGDVIRVRMGDENGVQIRGSQPQSL